uniref:ankyrin repeat-containing protein ITN1-like n=1 Tax=Erigeron canadensis TaxID=72917 RepID=UPI001CB9A870|nr:ankyrin repeat-containing protein ITN1-like [Erigeron canadensis]
MAASFGKHDMVRYLYSNYQNLTSHSWTHEKQGWLLLKCVEANLFDVALQICTDHPELATNGSVLSLLARKRGAFYVIRPNIICRFMRSIFHHMVDIPDKENHALRLLRFILTEIGKLPMAKFDDIIMGPPDETDEGKKQTGCEKEMKETLLQSTLSGDVAKMSDNISNQVKINGADNTTTSKDANKRYSSPVLFVAAEIGNTEFVVEVIKQYPHLVTEVNENNQSIFHVAVLNGHEGIYKLLYEMGSINELIVAREDKNGNNMLHLVGRSSASKRLQNIQGVGLRLNPELLWFKEIETLIPPCLREKKNVVGLTPYEAFMNSNKDLFSKGEKWMKEIAAQLMVVAALIATISFAALFTFPGGYDQLTGLPIFLPKFHFKVFIICDSFSFICSTNSILMVLSILGSKYDEYDFLVSLSKRLIICLASVFISIVTLSIAFLINTFLLYTTYYHWMPVLISVLTCIGYAIFVFSNYHLLGRYMRGFRMLYETGASARKFHSD